MSTPFVKLKRTCDGFKATVSRQVTDEFGNPCVRSCSSVLSSFKDGAVMSALSDARLQGLISRAEHQHYLIHGKFPKEDT